MFGVTRYVLVTVVRSAAGINYIKNKLTSGVEETDPELYVALSANKSLRNRTGNKYKRQNVIKEAFEPEKVKKVYQAYGLVGVKFEEFTAFKRSDLDNPIDRNDNVVIGDEIVLINNALLNVLSDHIGLTVSKHRIIPSRKSGF